jgi:hypothetical protein
MALLVLQTMSMATTRPAYKDAILLQRSAMKMVGDAEVKPIVKAQLMRAYVELEKLKRIMRGQPASTSQSIKDKPQRKKLVHWQPVEAPDEPDAAP